MDTLCKEVKMKYGKTCSELSKIMSSLYPRCQYFDTRCKAKVKEWNNDESSFAQGYCGGFGSVENIELIFVLAEPATTDKVDKNYRDAIKIPDPDYMVNVITNDVASVIENADGKKFHGNMRAILKGIYPDDTWTAIFRKVWITEAVLCQAKINGAQIPRDCEMTCAEKYLTRQIDVIRAGRNSAKVIALGDKAYRRLGLIQVEHDAHAPHPSCPPRYEPKQKWEELINKLS
jgi:hypothetical protein